MDQCQSGERQAYHYTWENIGGMIQNTDYKGGGGLRHQPPDKTRELLQYYGRLMDRRIKTARANPDKNLYRDPAIRALDAVLLEAYPDLAPCQRDDGATMFVHWAFGHGWFEMTAGEYIALFRWSSATTLEGVVTTWAGVNAGAILEIDDALNEIYRQRCVERRLSL